LVRAIGPLCIHCINSVMRISFKRISRENYKKKEKRKNQDLLILIRTLI